MRKSRLFNWSWDQYLLEMTQCRTFLITKCYTNCWSFRQICQQHVSYGPWTHQLYHDLLAKCELQCYIQYCHILYTANHVTWWYSEMILTTYVGFQSLPFCLQRRRITGIIILIWLDPIWANPAPERSFLTTKTSDLCKESQLRAHAKPMQNPAAYICAKV